MAELASIDPKAKPEFRKGERVRIVAGPIEEVDTLFDMHLAEGERVQILLA